MELKTCTLVSELAPLQQASDVPYHVFLELPITWQPTSYILSLLYLPWLHVPWHHVPWPSLSCRLDCKCLVRLSNTTSEHRCCRRCSTMFMNKCDSLFPMISSAGKSSCFRTVINLPTASIESALCKFCPISVSLSMFKIFDMESATTDTSLFLTGSN